jgi:hypothetical protein
MNNDFDALIQEIIELERKKEAALKRIAELETTQGIPYLRFASLCKWDHYEEVHGVFKKWRPALKYVSSDMPNSELGILVFDFSKIAYIDVVKDLVHLINHGALACSMRKLARVLVTRTNLSMSEESVYKLLKRYKKIFK